MEINICYGKPAAPSSRPSAVTHQFMPYSSLFTCLPIGTSPPILDNTDKVPVATVCLDAIDIFNGRRALITISHDHKPTP